MPDEPRHTKRAWLAVLLAAVAGFVDVVTYLYLAGLLAAPMTGNTVRVGLGIGTGQWSLAEQRLQAIPLFVLGVMVVVLLCELAALRHEGHVSVALPLGLEWLLLGAFWAVSTRLARDGALQLDTPWQYTCSWPVPWGRWGSRRRRSDVWATSPCARPSSPACWPPSRKLYWARADTE